MHYESTNLPTDVQEVFFSDVYYYAASVESTSRGRPKYVGCGVTREQAYADMRQAAIAKSVRCPSSPLVVVAGVASFTADQRQTLAENLRRLRLERGLSQLQVARQALGFTKSHAAVSRLERGGLGQVHAAQLEQLATFYDVRVTSLLSVPDTH